MSSDGGAGPIAGSPRVAIVTGASRGIGAATVRTLSAAGFLVAAVDLSPSTEDAQAALFLRSDVSDPDAVAQLVAAVMDRFGRIDALINCAGIIDVHSVDELADAEWDRVMAVNVKSVFLMSRSAIPHLRESGHGSIVNLASVHAVATVPKAAVYAASKGAVVALSRQMALDYYDDGIRVNSVVVGSVDTQMSRQHGIGMAESGVVLADHPGAIGRQAKPEEVASVIAFLCSDDASFVTGSPLVVDGGMLARLM